MQATDYLEDGFLNHFFLNTGFTKPVGLEVSYWDSDPTDSGTAAIEIEPFGAGVRAPIVFGNSVSRQVQNTTEPQQTAVTGGTANYMAVHRTDLASQMLAYGEIQATPGGIAQPMTFVAGQPIQITAGSLIIRMLQESSPEECHSDAIVNEWLSFVFGSGASTPPAQHFLSLHTGDPSETGLLELTGGNYARAGVTWGPPSDGAGGRRQVRNTIETDFTNLTQSYAWWGVWTSASAGTFLTRSDQVDQIITPGDNASAAIDALAILAG